MAEQLDWQHATAAVSGVKLKSVAKVLRGLLILAEIQHEWDLYNELHRLLESSTSDEYGTFALHDKPTEDAVRRTTECLLRVNTELGPEVIRDIKLLVRDPFDEDNWGNYGTHLREVET